MSLYLYKYLKPNTLLLYDTNLIITLIIVLLSRLSPVRLKTYLSFILRGVIGQRRHKTHAKVEIKAISGQAETLDSTAAAPGPVTPELMADFSPESEFPGFDLEYLTRRPALALAR